MSEVAMVLQHIIVPMVGFLPQLLILPPHLHPILPFSDSLLHLTIHVTA